MAGKEAKKLSFDLILASKPSNINIESPPDDISRMGLKNRPTNKPKAPSISRIITTIPRSFKSNRLNSFFILGEIKYEIEYPAKEMLENKTQ